jgi:hypothetical protein
MVVEKRPWNTRIGLDFCNGREPFVCLKITRLKATVRTGSVTHTYIDVKTSSSDPVDFALTRLQQIGHYRELLVPRKRTSGLGQFAQKSR